MGGGQVRYDGGVRRGDCLERLRTHTVKGDVNLNGQKKAVVKYLNLCKVEKIKKGSITS